MNIHNPISRVTPQPFTALIFHKSEEEQSISNVTRHPIEGGVIKHGEYVSVKEVKKLLAKIQNTQESSAALIPRNVIINSETQLIWYVKAKKRDMWVKLNGKEHKLSVIYPALLFCCSKKRKLKIFALASNKRPTLSSLLYNAPLMNVSSNGDVCQGTAQLPVSIDISTIPEIEDTIFESNFTHVNNQKTLKIKGLDNVSSQDHLKFWQRHCESGLAVRKSDLNYFGRLTSIIK